MIDIASGEAKRSFHLAAASTQAHYRAVKGTERAKSDDQLSRPIERC
jgi:hypothetical protein